MGCHPVILPIVMQQCSWADCRGPWEHSSPVVIGVLLKSECPLLLVVARATDRRHSVDLLRAGADLQVRETFESAVVMGAAALEHLGVDAGEIPAISARIRESVSQEKP